MPHSLLLIEDQTLVRKSLAALLNTTADFVVTASVESVADALTQLQAPTGFDLILCDYHLRNETADDLLRHSNRLPPVVLLSSAFNAIEIQHCMKLGARGFLFKECDLDELEQALHSVLAGSVYFTPGCAAATSRPGGGETLTLTPSEQETLRWLATGMSNKQIALTLGKSSETVKIQVSQLLRKLNTRTRTQAVVKAGKLNLL